MGSTIVVLGNAHSPHTKSFCESLAQKGQSVYLFSIENNSKSISPQRYDNPSIRVFDDFCGNVNQERAFSLKESLSDFVRENSPRCLVTIGLNAYSKICATPDFANTKRVLVCLGSDIVLTQSLGVSQELKDDVYDLVVSPSEFLAGKVRLLTRSEVVVAPFGIGEFWFDSPTYNDTELRYFLTPKYYSWIYGHKLIIDACSLIAESLRERRFSVVFCGGELPYKYELEDYAVTKDVADIVRFEGYKEKEELRDLYCNAKSTLLASSYESFGMAIAESMACGTPVIAPRIPGFESVTNGHKLSFSFDPGSPPSLSRQILAAIDAPESKNELKAFAEKFKKDACAEEIVRHLGEDSGFDEEPISDGAQKRNIVFFHNQWTKREILDYASGMSARSLRVAGILRALEEFTNVVDFSIHSRKVREDALSSLNLKRVDGVYIEIGSALCRNRISFLEEVFRLCEARNIPCLYFYSDCYPFDYLYSVQMAPKLIRVLEQKRFFVKLNKLLRHYPSVAIGVPSRKFARLARLTKHKNHIVPIPPGSSERRKLPADRLEHKKTSSTSLKACLFRWYWCLLPVT